MTVSSASVAGMARCADSVREDGYYPTPPWATRGFLQAVLPLVEPRPLGQLSVWEPAAGQGHMAAPLREVFGAVYASDLVERGDGAQHDFLMPYLPLGLVDSGVDWIITNPPFKLAEDFMHRALAVAGRGVAMLVPTRYIEGVGRYNRLFRDQPPTVVAQYAERVPMVKGRYDPAATTATAYLWLVWARGVSHQPLMWIPPCRPALERPDDILIGGAS